MAGLLDRLFLSRACETGSHHWEILRCWHHVSGVDVDGSPLRNTRWFSAAYRAEFHIASAAARFGRTTVSAGNVSRASGPAIPMNGMRSACAARSSVIESPMANA